MILERRGQRGGPGIYMLAGVMSSLTRFPDVAPAPRVLTEAAALNDAYVERTLRPGGFVLAGRSIKKHLVQTTENTRLPKTRCVPQQALSGLPMPLTISAKCFLSFQVQVHGFPNSPSCSIHAGRIDHQVELLAMSDR
ncbi:hypothetical protein L210DRAFT_949419 [Boletus edulis BED1]|uniref:Uncharacterized protein n=1 Tax=Boletus edulis BED1 TaxID=1328754 RepID=A0AAD4BGN7_BOLED|nr:hypothetical protein L210DRAFT_949419 [Boletus edulis BED1]